jgi:chorismate mutase
MSNMTFKPILEREGKRPILIAGPCSAESEEQVLQTAHELAAAKQIDIFRAGIWKPRTRPGEFEGVGAVGLPWLKKVKEETGLKVTTEVGNRDHVFEALKAGIDVLWIGARTTVNPFSIQEVADALRGVDIPVIVKNPVNPDLKLWMGGIERIYKAGITRIAAIHRGFSFHGDTIYRNVPHWQIAIDLRRNFPDIEIICDNSHICGRRDILQDVAQKAMDLNFDGLMTEVHPDPDKAWSDAAQQITPAVYAAMINSMVFPKGAADGNLAQGIGHLRHEIDEIDQDLINLLGRRMKIAEKIGSYKKENNLSVLQTSRWNEILAKAVQQGSKKGLSEEFVTVVLKAIHDESINHQIRVMHGDDTAN